MLALIEKTIGTSSVQVCPSGTVRNMPMSTARCSEEIFRVSMKWSSHSPCGLPPPRSRATCPSAESQA